MNLASGLPCSRATDTFRFSSLLTTFHALHYCSHFCLAIGVLDTSFSLLVCDICLWFCTVLLSFFFLSFACLPFRGALFLFRSVAPRFSCFVFRTPIFRLYRVVVSGVRNHSTSSFFLRGPRSCTGPGFGPQPD